MKITVIGASGLIGTKVVQLVTGNGTRVFGRSVPTGSAVGSALLTNTNREDR